MSSVTCTRFFTNFASRLNTIRRESQFCDVTLIVNGKEYSAHRAILAASCNYFRALFTTAMVEKNSRIVKLEIPPSITEELLTFLYTGNTALCESNAKELLIAADYLMIDELKELCGEYFSQTLSSLNCLQIYLLGWKYNCNEMRKKAETFVLKQFPLLCKSDEFNALELHQLINIICHDDLVVDGEEQVYEAIVSWVNYQFKERARFFDELFQCIRLSSLSEDFVKDKVAQNLLVRQGNTCTTTLVKERLQSTFIKNFHQSRKCLQIREQGIVCIGGRAAGKTLKSVAVYQPYHDKWLQQRETPLDKEEHIVLLCNNTLYVIGGMRKPNNVECFYPSTNEWSTVGRLTQRAISAAGVCVDGKIFIIGGKDGFESVSTVQCYDPCSNNVETLTSLPFPRQALSAVGLNGDIYAIGGCTCNDTFNTVDKLNPSNGLSWQQATPMKHHRKYACADVLQSGRILVAGGYQDTNPIALDRCEIYNPVSNDWQEICSLSVPRAAAGVASIGNRMYVLGGRSNAASTDTIEYYDEDDNKWHMVPRRLPYPCAWLQCSVVSAEHFLISDVEQSV